jgi:hypothetical protein
MSDPTIVEARVIPWESADELFKYGVHIRWSDGKHAAYRVGLRETAEREVRRALAGRTPLHLVPPAKE